MHDDPEKFSNIAFILKQQFDINCDEQTALDIDFTNVYHNSLTNFQEIYCLVMILWLFKGCLNINDRFKYVVMQTFLNM